eukprot:scaffold58560_cov21-Phaeocystis_antarctica.AAC.1
MGLGVESGVVTWLGLGLGLGLGWRGLGSGLGLGERRGHRERGAVESTQHGEGSKAGGAACT